MKRYELFFADGKKIDIHADSDTEAYTKAVCGGYDLTDATKLYFGHRLVFDFTE